MIPKILQRPEFRFVLLNKPQKCSSYPKHDHKKCKERGYKFCELSKAPFEKDWPNNGYKFNDPKLLQHLKQNGNYGIICGYGNLRILDIDDKNQVEKWKKEMSETFMVETGSGGLHIYFLTDYESNHVLKDGLGEFRANNYQCVGAGSTHPNGNVYKPLNNNLIVRIDKEMMEGWLKPYLKDSDTGEQKDLSRSGEEWRVVLSQLNKGLTIPQIKSYMDTYTKWNEQGEGYQEYTLKKALENFKKIPRGLVEPQTAEVKKLEVFDHKQMREYEPMPQEWLIENQIPKSEVGLLVGKRGERKTFVGLYQALCLASGKTSFGINKVPEPKKVLIVDEESGINELAKRIQALEKGLNISKDLEIKYISFEGLKLNNGNATFMKLLEEYKPDLILVDCLQRVVTFEVDKDNASISEFFTEIVRPTIKKYGTSWLFIHHLRKSPPNKYNPEDLLDEVRGGSELTNYCRFVLLTQLPRHQESKENIELVIFRVLKMSNAPIPEPMVISFESNDGAVKVNYEGLPKDILSAEVRCANAIKEWLFTKQIVEFRTKDLQEASEEIGAKKTLLSYGLNLLLKQGYLQKVKRGFWKVSEDSNGKEK